MDPSIRSDLGQLVPKKKTQILIYRETSPSLDLIDLDGMRAVCERQCLVPSE